MHAQLADNLELSSELQHSSCQVLIIITIITIRAIRVAAIGVISAACNITGRNHRVNHPNYNRNCS